MEEIWKNVIGYEELYQVSNYGRIKSLNYNHTGEERILKPGKDNREYIRVILCKNGKIKAFKVHRLECEAFIPNPQGLPQVNHKDENKQNNFIWVNEDGSVDFEKSNLEWCDRKYNCNFGTRNKRVAEKHSLPIIATVIATGEVEFYPSAKEAGRQLNCHRTDITQALKGRYKTACKRTWKYA